MLIRFWCAIFVGILLSNWEVESFEIISGNDSFFELESYLDVDPPPGALMVPLTLMQGAAAEGAGKSLSVVLKNCIF